MELFLGDSCVRVGQARRPGTVSEDSLEGVDGESALSSVPNIPSLSSPGCSQLEKLVVEVAAHYSVMGCAFVIEGENGALKFVAYAGPDLERVAQDGREKGDRGLFRHHTGRAAPVLIEDLSAMDYFSEDPLVQQPPSLRLYVGAPVRRDGGSHMGLLAIYDDKPRKRKRFGYDDCAFLEEKACEVAKHITPDIFTSLVK